MTSSNPHPNPTHREYVEDELERLLYQTKLQIERHRKFGTEQQLFRTRSTHEALENAINTIRIGG